MNTEASLRERAEAILNNYRDDSKYPNINEVVISKNDAIDFALDFHKQELQRIGEVYVPVSVEDELPPEEQWYGIINKFGVVRQGYYKEESKTFFLFDTTHADATHWLKKLSVNVESV